MTALPTIRDQMVAMQVAPAPPPLFPPHASAQGSTIAVGVFGAQMWNTLYMHAHTGHVIYVFP